MHDAGLSAVNQILFLNILKRSTMDISVIEVRCMNVNIDSEHTCDKSRKVQIVRTPEVESKLMHIPVPQLATASHLTSAMALTSEILRRQSQH